MDTETEQLWHGVEPKFNVERSFFLPKGFLMQYITNVLQSIVRPFAQQIFFYMHDNVRLHTVDVRT